MSHKKKFKKQQVAAAQTVAATNVYTNQQGPVNKNSLKWILAALLAAFAFLLYVQTLQFDYVLDDHSVIARNKLVQKGIGGIPEILKTDYWYGYTDKLRGHQYRPLSLVTFAVEYEVAPLKPMLGHFVNIVLYAITCALVFLLLANLFSASGYLVAFIAALLFTAHPIHTEVVSNIKSRDEILCLLFGIGALFAALRYFKKAGVLYAVLSGVCLLLSMMSKETGIAFLLLVPLTGYYFSGQVKVDWKKLGTSFFILLAFTAIYFFLRQQAVQGVKTMDIVPIDNTLVLANGKSEEWGTAFSILLRYVGLLVAPVKLSYDYSYSQIAIVGFNNPMAMFGLLVYLALGVMAVLGLKRKKKYSWAIFFFLLTLFPVSNLFLKIGSTMAERFLYIPSIGFCVLLALFVSRLFRIKEEVEVTSTGRFFSRYAMPLLLVFVVSVVFAGRTISRNAVWKDNPSLFASGIKTAPKSARTHMNWGIANLNHFYPAATNKNERAQYLAQARSSLEEAFAIFPGYYEAGNPLGDVLLKQGDNNNAIRYYNEYLSINPTDNNIQNNKAAAYMNLQQYQQAIPILDSVLKRLPNDTTALKNMGRCYGYTSEFATAASYFETCIKLNPSVAENYQLAATAYQFMGDVNKANQYFEQAKKLQ